MDGKKPTPAMDKKLMKRAKERVLFRSILKWNWMSFLVTNGLIVAGWFLLSNRETFWPGYVIAAWGFSLIVVTIVFKTALLSDNTGNAAKVTAEYNKLKEAAAVKET